MDRTPPWQAIALAALVAAVAAPSWWFYAGPWRWLTELQFTLFGAESLQLTVIGLLIAYLLLLAPLAAYHQVRQTPKQAPPDLGWLKHASGQSWLLAGVLGAMALFFGAQALLAGERADVGHAELSTHPASYLRTRVSGADLEWAIGLGDDWYIPVFDGDTVALVFTLDPLYEPVLDDLGDGSGMRVVGGLPGPVREEWSRRGLDVPRTIPVIDVKASPGQRIFLSAFLGFGALLATAWGFWKRRSA